MLSSNTHSVNEHFENRAPSVRTTYQAILKASTGLGPVAEEAKKTSIHLVRKTAFSGVATRKTALILTLKSASEIKSKRIAKRAQTSANPWRLEVRLEAPEEIDAAILKWLSNANDVAG